MCWTTWPRVQRAVPVKVRLASGEVLSLSISFCRSVCRSSPYCLSLCRSAALSKSYGPWFKVKLPSYQYTIAYRISHCGEKTVAGSSYLHNGNFYLGKTSSKVILNQTAGPWFNIKMTSYQYRKSHCGNKTILRPSYLHNGISYTGKTTSLYWIKTLDSYLAMFSDDARCIKTWHPYHTCTQIFVLFQCHIVPRLTKSFSTGRIVLETTA